MKFLPLLPVLTRYPFLKISGSVFKFDPLQEIKRYPEVIEKAKEIVKHAIEGKVYESRYVKEADFFCIDCEERCYECDDVGKLENCNLCMRCFENCQLSYPENIYREYYVAAKRAVLTHIASRMIVSALDDWVRMRYAVNEGNYYRKLLEGEKDVVLRLISADMNVKLRGWDVHVSTFIRASSRIRDDEWRLVNRRLKDGFVKATRREVVRILEELLRSKLFEKVPVVKPVVQPVIEDLNKKALQEAKKFEFDLGEVDLNCLPPCMKEILSELKRGMNIPHTARFAITSFLLNIGMDVDGVISLFKSAPDFDEEKTRYQVEHIAGERGKGAEYISPSCDTMKTYHNCVGECGVNHPLTYYRRCKSKKMR